MNVQFWLIYLVKKAVFSSPVHSWQIRQSEGCWQWSRIRDKWERRLWVSLGCAVGDAGYERNGGMTLSHSFLYHLLLSLNACTGCTTKTCHCHTHTHTHTHTHFTVRFTTCWKVEECFPDERIILKHAGDIEHNYMSSLLQASPPRHNWAFDPHPIKASMVLSHVLLSVFTGFDSQRQRLGITEDLLSSIQKPSQAFTLLSLQFGHEFVWLMWKKFSKLRCSCNGDLECGELWFAVGIISSS